MQWSPTSCTGQSSASYRTWTASSASTMKALSFPCSLVRPLSTGQMQHKSPRSAFQLHAQSHRCIPLPCKAASAPLHIHNVCPAGAPPDVPEDSRVDHRFLRCAVDILGAAARLMGSEDVQWVVARRLFSKEPFLDFACSDPAARSFLLRSGFDLLETAVCRGIPVRA